MGEDRFALLLDVAWSAPGSLQSGDHAHALSRAHAGP